MESRRKTINKSEFEYNLIDLKDDNITFFGNKTLYNIDNAKKAKDWIKEPIKGIKTISKPTFSSALVLATGPNCKTKIHEDALGCYSNMGNSVDQNEMKVSLFCCCDSSNANGLSILPQNITRITALFSARKLISKNWINSKDEYLAPNEQHAKWKEFVGDSLVYSLFHTSSNQSSLRNIEYKGKTWSIFNEFFFMSREEMMQLAENNKLYETHEEIRTDKDRFAYQLLELVCGRANVLFKASLPEQTRNTLPETLSEEALAVLKKAREITRNSFPFRQLFNEEHPEYQILNWDCGWYQIKALAKEYAKKEMTEFDALYKSLADKMRPLVYEVGFLK